MVLELLWAWKVGLAHERYLHSAVYPNTPQWNNPMLPHLFKLSEPIAWTKFHFKLVKDILKDILSDLSLCPFDYFVPSSYLFSVPTVVPCFTGAISPLVRLSWCPWSLKES